MNDFIDQLEQIEHQFIARLKGDPVVSRLLAGTISRPHLVAFYTQIWHCVRETPPALGNAARSMKLYAGDDPRFAGPAFARFKSEAYRELIDEMSRHEREEEGHDDWMMSDLNALGVSAEEVRNSRPLPSMAAYVATIRHASLGPAPVGVWGQAYVLEGVSAKLWAGAVKNLVERSGIPNVENAVYCLKQHAITDVGHRGEDQARLRLFTDPEDRAAIVFNARATHESWGRVGQDIVRYGDS
jgi:hypothetical protein